MVGLARGLRNHGVDHAGSVLRFLHLLCEGHNLEMQDFLRFQPGALPIQPALRRFTRTNLDDRVSHC